MKKFYILLIAMAITAGTAFAQSNDSIERAKQQEALLKQQQKEQQELLQQQQKEQERLQKEQQKAAQKAQEERMKEQQKLQKEQQKEAEKAAKKEQDRIKREQTKAENKAKAEQKKAERKRKREEHYAAWNRRPNFTADPSVAILADRLIYTKNSFYNSIGANVGVTFDYHRPIAKRWDFNVGIGYRFTYLTYSHLFSSAELDAGLTRESFNGNEESRTFSTVMVPIKISHINKDNNHGWYLGVAPGFNFGTKNASSAKFNKFRCDLAIGTQSRWFIFSPGTEVYFNLLPTYTSGDTKIHEFGIRFVL
jgi:flagellar motor protein MotB